MLFVCVHNAGRSQMAAGSSSSARDGRIHVRSAGSDPGRRDQPGRRRGDGRDRHRHRRGVPKPLTDEVVRAADVVITMGCGDACPSIPGKRYEDWELDDPAGQDLEAVRAIRDEIDTRVRSSLWPSSWVRCGSAGPAWSRSGGDNPSIRCPSGRNGVNEGPFWWSRRMPRVDTGSGR